MQQDVDVFKLTFNQEKAIALEHCLQSIEDMKFEF